MPLNEPASSEELEIFRPLSDLKTEQDADVASSQAEIGLIVTAVGAARAIGAAEVPLTFHA